MGNCGSEECGCSNEEDSCCGGSCGCESKESGHEYDSGSEMMDTLLNVADSAWMNLIAEKMKHHWEKHMGAQMDKIAKAAVEASATHHMGKMKSKADMEEALERLREAAKME